MQKLIGADMRIERPSYIKQLAELKDNGRVKVITGVRRCGKSYLLSTLYKEYLLQNGISSSQIIELALDNIVNASYRNPLKLYEYFRAQMSETGTRYYLFIDEIQLCAEIDNPDVPGQKLTFIDTVIGLMQLPDTDVYVTGSNSRMLSSDILTEFNDRSDEIHVMPLSFAEYYAACEDKAHAWRDYVTFGGMPYVLSLDTPEKKSRYLKNLFDETYIKDIIGRWRLEEKKDVLDTLLEFVASSAGSLINPSKLEKRFLSLKGEKVYHADISKYLDIFRDSFLIRAAKRYDIKGSKYFETPLKYYFSDSGLRNACINFRQIEETHLMETIIYNELIRRGYNVDVGVIGYSRRNAEGKPERIQLEVDFVINHINKRCYIQSAYSLEDPEKRAQALNSLSRIDDSFQKLVIVHDETVPRYDEKGIFYVGVRDFLLDESLLRL